VLGTLDTLGISSKGSFDYLGHPFDVSAERLTSDWRLMATAPGRLKPAKYVAAQNDIDEDPSLARITVAASAVKFCF